MENTQQLDPQALTAAKALRRTETGTSTNPYQAKGASGEFGAYQFMPATYKTLAKKYLGDENAAPSVENQNKIAYSAAKEAKDSGKTPAQFASEWNSGKANAYKEGLTGTNAKGVNYDVPAYVAKFSQFYNELKDNGETIAGKAPIPTEVPKSNGGALGTAASVADTLFGSGKVGEALGTSYVKGNLANRTDIALPDYANLPDAAKARLVAKGVPITKEDQLKETAGTIKGPSLGELAGSIGQSALFFTPEGKVVDALGGGLTAKTLAGAATGYGYDVANNFQNDKTGLGLFKPGAGTVLGAATPLALAGGKALYGAAKPAVAVAGSIGEGVGNVLSAPFRFIGDKLKSAAEIAALPEAERGLAKSGFSEPARTFLTTATPETKNAFRQMIDVSEKGSADLRSKVQTKDVVGKEFLKPVDAIATDAKQAGSVIQKEAMRPGKVGIGSVVQDFKDKLESKGVLFRKDGTLVSTGRVPRSDLKYYESILDEIKDVTGGRANVPRSQAHALRQRLYDTLDAATKMGGQPGTKPFSNLVDNDVNSLRSSIADLMGEKYKDAVKRYAVNQSTLGKVAKFAGVPAKIENISSKSLKLGEGLMRALGNASDKPTSLINEVVELAKQRGHKSSVNLNDLIDFADNLENLYGIKQTRSFEGGIQRGVNQSGLPTIPTNKTEMVMKAMQAATKTSNQDKINALKGFLGIK